MARPYIIAGFAVVNFEALKNGIAEPYKRKLYKTKAIAERYRLEDSKASTLITVPVYIPSPFIIEEDSI